MPEFEPKSRNEYLLNEIRKNTEGGGSGLPDVTDADDGKVLGVDAGEWVPTVNTIIINGTMTSQTGGTWTSEYTLEEIGNAYANGARIIVHVPDVADVAVGWIDQYKNMYALVYMSGVINGVVLVKASDVANDIDGTRTRSFSFIPVG